MNYFEKNVSQYQSFSLSLHRLIKTTNMVEFNEVLLSGAEHTVTMRALDGRMTCITGGTPYWRSRWLEALMGFEFPKHGFISIDGEPMTPSTLAELRALMAYAPYRLDDEGEVVVYEAPTVQDVFSLKANRDVPISNGILAEEHRHTGDNGPQGLWLAVAVLRKKPILLVDSPPAATADYLQRQAYNEGRTVIVASADKAIVDKADTIVEL